MTFTVPLRLPAISVKAARTSIAVAAVLITVWAQWAPNGAPYLDGEWLRDRLLRAQASDAEETRIAVIDIDESSLARSGPWPWPRQRIAHLIENLLGPYGARGVALDLVLPEPADSEGDARLAKLAQYGPVVLPQAFDFDGAMPLRVGKLINGSPAASPAGSVVANGYIANHAGLSLAAHTGNIGFVPDRDGMIRRLPMQTWFNGQNYPTLSLALINCCAAAAPHPAPGPTGGMADGGGMRRIPYSRTWEAYAVIPAAAVLALEAPLELISGRLVLIGSSSLGLSDRVSTPLTASTSGLLVHAAALTAQLDARSGLSPHPWPARAISIMFSFCIAALTLYTLPRLPAWINVAMLSAASALWLGLAYLMVPHDALFSTTAPLLSNLFLLATGVPFAWQLSQRQSHRLLGTLRQYVADAVVDELMRSNLSDPLIPVRREVTTLIADMEGYTKHVASLPVEAAAQLTRDFLNCLTAPVLALHGTLDKYTGDGLVAFWGAPLPLQDHADQALDAAQQILRAMDHFNDDRAARGLPPVRVRIGIESGEAMAGDFGSTSRSIYTAVGDSVNVASRLETAARDLPYDLIVGPGTRLLSRRHQLVQIGKATLRGKNDDTPLYTLQMLVKAE